MHWASRGAAEQPRLLCTAQLLHNTIKNNPKNLQLSNMFPNQNPPPPKNENECTGRLIFTARVCLCVKAEWAAMLPSDIHVNKKRAAPKATEAKLTKVNRQAGEIRRERSQRRNTQWSRYIMLTGQKGSLRRSEPRKHRQTSDAKTPPTPIYVREKRA